ncbi:MAG: YunC family protein [Candidatus Omnitrophota bacterium]
MCGYLNIKVAEKFGEAACVVKGVNSIEDLLKAPIFNLTKKAYSLGVRKWMSGKEAILKLS